MRHFAVLALAALLFAPGSALASYFVYCSAGRIEVDSRGLDQLTVARGAGLCRVGPVFEFLSDAQGVAQRNFGGPGRACRCR